MAICPCGSEKDYLICCGAFIERDNIPATPEQLMRSRYTAYTQANIDYIAQTMKGVAAKNFNAEEAREWAQRVEWNKLTVIQTSTEETKGFVEFIAYFYENKKRHAIHEISEFHRENGRWFYVAGKAPEQKSHILEPRISRNDPCHCGSQKKYKKCCGKPIY